MTPFRHVAQLVPTAPGQPSGSLNCNAAVGAMLIAHATAGKHTPTASQVRARTLDTNGKPDKAGGTTLRQVADAAHRGWGVTIDVRTPWEWSELREHAKRTPDAAYSISLWYGALRGTPAYASLAGFVENHQVAARWNGEPGREWATYDPLADGRSPRVPRAPVFVSDSVLRGAAGQLALRTDPRSRNVLARLGPGLVYVGIVRAPKPTPAPTRTSVRFTGGAAFWVYDTDGRDSVRFASDTSAPCNKPVRVLFNGKPKFLSLVTAGALKGLRVEPGRDGVQLT